MRSNPNPPPAVRPQLTVQRAAIAVGVLLLASAVSGGAGSPVAPLLVLPLVLLLREARHRRILLAPPAAAALLLLVSRFAYALDVRALLGAAAVATGSYAGFLWRREARRNAGRLLQLDDILAQAGRGVASGGDDAEAYSAVTRAAHELADLQRSLGSLATRLHAESATLWSVDGSAGVARPLATSASRQPAPVRLAGDPLGWIWAEGMRLRLDPTPAWAPAGAQVVAERLRRVGDVGEIVSFLYAAGTPLAEDTDFEPAAVLLRGILALYDERAVAAVKSQRVRALTDGLRRIPGELQLDAFARHLCETAASVTDATGAAVATWDGETGTVLAAIGEDGGPQVGDGFTAPLSELALAVRADAMLVRDGHEWNLGPTAVAHAREQWRHRPRSLAALPLRGRTGIIGVLGVWSSASRTLDPDALELLHLMSPYAALHLEHARAFGRLRETAERDPLTQLRNRRAFDEIFAAELNRFERYGRNVALMMLDIDHFKDINDRFGHEAGDEVLRRVARLLSASVRDTDTAARYGGEEFVVLLPETSLRAATDVAERVRSGVAALDIDWRGARIPVRISIGVTAVPERLAHPRDLVASADAALYQAKAAGRDRVMTA